MLATLAGCGWGPPQPLFTVSGQVLDQAGDPVSGAVVSDGEAATLTDDAGRFSLGVFQASLTVVKPGYRRASTEAEEGRTTLFRLQDDDAGAPRVAVDTRWGGPVKGLKLYLAEQGLSVKDYTGGSLAEADALIMLTPGGMSDGDLERLTRWVHAGGRLVLAGEWGGYPAQNLEVLNALAEPAGITFTGATVKASPEDGHDVEWLTVPGVEPDSLDAAVGDDGLHLFTCTSLHVGPGARPLFESGRRTYSVLSTMGPQVLAAVGASGYGKVFALGDSSLWLDEDSGDVGEPNWSRGANGRLADALVRW